MAKAKKTVLEAMKKTVDVKEIPFNVCCGQAFL